MLQGSILQQLESAHCGDKKSLNFGVYYKNTLIALCHALEDFILESEGKPLTIAAFQLGKWYLQEADRYREIAKVSSEVVIMAAAGTGFSEHQTSQLSNVSLVGLEAEDPVAQEWHLIILSPEYTAMVLCQELSPTDYGVRGQPSTDKERKFYGFWTFEPELVRETAELAIAHIGHYHRDLQHRLSSQLERMPSGMMRWEDLSSVVSRVVNYLQTSQEDLQLIDSARLSEATSYSQALDDNLISNEMQALLRMAQLIDLSDANNPMAAAEVATLAEAMGQLLDLPAWQVKRLRLAGLLHRVVPLQRVEATLESSQSRIQQAALEQKTNQPKASVLRIMPRLKAIAQIIACQNEHWDGSGQPNGLAYDEIPLESRILALTATFQQRVNLYQSEAVTDPLNRALTDCKTEAGKAFDPKLVETLELLVRGLQQGLSLQATLPKIAAGIWLIDDEEVPEQLQLSAES